MTNYQAMDLLEEVRFVRMRGNFLEFRRGTRTFYIEDLDYQNLPLD